MKENYETGLKNGIEQGIEIHSIKIPIRLLDKKSDQQIAELTELPIERIKQLRTENKSR